jgi:uncharacterized protein (DUF1499 family)
MIGLTALAITLILVVATCLKVDDWDRDWTENSASASFQIDGLSSEQAVKHADDWAAKESLWTVNEKAIVTDGIEMQLLRRTPIFRFTDDISLLIKSVDSGVVIEASSQSRLGKGDLGQNPRNLIELRKAWP